MTLHAMLMLFLEALNVTLFWTVTGWGRTQVIDSFVGSSCLLNCPTPGRSAPLRTLPEASEWTMGLRSRMEGH